MYYKLSFDPISKNGETVNQNHLRIEPISIILSENLNLER